MICDRAWYDEVLVEAGSPAMLPLEDSPWLPLYREVGARIHPTFDVVDLGCGTGRFIALLRQEGHQANIVGVDWSEAALAEAREYAAPPDDGCAVRFECGDLDEWTADAITASTVFVCLETFEHLNDDLDLIRRIPPGHTLLFSVPNFWTESHRRVFRDVSNIWERYKALLTFRSWRLIGEDKQGIHLLEAVRRGDAW